MTAMRSFFLLYGISALVFLAIDVVGLTFILKPTFEAYAPQLLADDPNFVAAAIFYFMYIAGIVWFASAPGLRSGAALAQVFGNGALLGIFAYGTYELTNMATLAGWAWPMVAVDMVWGAALTGLTAAGGVAIARRIGS